LRRRFAGIEISKERFFAMITLNTVRVLAVSAAALATLGVVSAASAEPMAASVAVSQDYSAPAPETKYCVSTTVTGSRIAHRDCKTKADWAAEGVVVELKKARD
jgi:hypothetical protein